MPRKRSERDVAACLFQVPFWKQPNSTKEASKPNLKRAFNLFLSRLSRLHHAHVRPPLIFCSMHRASEDYRADQTCEYIYLPLFFDDVKSNSQTSERLRVLSETFTTLQRYLSLFHVYACSYTFVYIC